MLQQFISKTSVFASLLQTICRVSTTCHPHLTKTKSLNPKVIKAVFIPCVWSLTPFSCVVFALFSICLYPQVSLTSQWHTDLWPAQFSVSPVSSVFQVRWMCVFRFSFSLPSPPSLLLLQAGSHQQEASSASFRSSHTDTNQITPDRFSSCLTEAWRRSKGCLLKPS